MKKVIMTALVVLAITSLTGCGAFRNSISKGFDALGAKDYTVTVFSGGVAVKSYEINNSFVNSEENTDGWFFYVNGKLVRVTGTIVISER